MTVKFKSQATQGDCLITKISQIPEEIKALEPSKDGLNIVAHSETSNHHVVDEGIYEIRRQKEYTPEGHRMIAD